MNPSSPSLLVRIPRSQLACASALLAAALLTLGLDLGGSCAACGGAGPIHGAIAAVGALGYAALLALGGLRRARAFRIGVVAAGAVHTALAGWLAAAAEPCPPCIAALALNLVLVALVL